MSEEKKPGVVSEANTLQDSIHEAKRLDTFNDKLKNLQEEFKLKLIGVPHFNPDGTVGTTIQVIDLTKIVDGGESKEDTPVVEGEGFK